MSGRSAGDRDGVLQALRETLDVERGEVITGGQRVPVFGPSEEVWTAVFVAVSGWHSKRPATVSQGPDPEFRVGFVDRHQGISSLRDDTGRVYDRVRGVVLDDGAASQGLATLHRG